MSWTPGYTFRRRPDEAETWADVRDGFRWELPDTYNLAGVALDGDRHAVALDHVDRHGVRHRFSYGDLGRATDRLTSKFAAMDIDQGDRVGVCLPQCPEHLLVHLAVYRLGGVVVPLSMLLGEETMTYSLEHSGASALIIDREPYEALETVPDDVKETVVVDTGAGYLGEETNPNTTTDRALKGLLGTDDNHVTQREDPVETAPDDPALILYTSGTSGDPKGVLVGHQYLVGSLPAFHCYFHLFTPETARTAHIWTPSEWAWAGALFDVVFPTLALGGTVASRERRSGFNPDTALSFVNDVGVTHAFLPPTALGRIRAESTVEDHSADSLSVVMCGGEKLPPALFRWAEDALDVTLNESYGQTEANGLVSNCQAAFSPEEGSMGRPIPGHEIAVLDEDGVELPPGKQGELAVRSPDPVLLEEYWQNPDETASKFTDDGWFLTGDLVRRDECGLLWHEGRADDLIITSAYRVTPLEVERTLADDPAVADAVVGGVPDNDRGELVKAYVVAAAEVEDREALRTRLQTHVREVLGAHKVPRKIAFVDSFPETRSGKTNRAALFNSA